MRRVKINGRCTVHNNEKCELPCYGHLMPEAHNYRPAAALINQDCQFHRSTLLLNFNCTDNISNIKFNAALKISKLDVLTEMTSSLGSRQRKQTFRFALLDNFLT